MKLSTRCRTEALKDPSGCRTRAGQKAISDCSTYTGIGRGNCMDARFEYHLALECKDIVCPGDPFALEVSEMNRPVVDTSRAAEGGGFSTAEEELVARMAAQQNEAARQGLQVTDLQKYLWIALGVVGVLALAMRKR